MNKEKAMDIEVAAGNINRDIDMLITASESRGKRAKKSFKGVENFNSFNY